MSLTNENLFSILGVQAREDCVSNAIAYAINTSSSFRREFINHLCKKDITQYHSVTAYTRVSAGHSGIPDIVVALEKNSIADLIIIENKLKADEGPDQTTRYTSQDAIDRLTARLLPGKVLGDTFFVFMTLFPDQHPVSSNYLVYRHSELLKIFDTITIWESALAQQVVRDWCVLVKDFYERECVDPSDVFYDKLQDTSGLDAGYLYFRSALRQLRLPSALCIEFFFRSSQQGRRYYGAVISKDSWHPSEMGKVDRTWKLDPYNYNIHLEPQYNVLARGFNCYLHYEVNPYEPERWVRENISKADYDVFLERRNEFSKRLQSQNLPHWSFGGGSNQIAKIALDFTKATYEEVSNTLQSEIGTMAKAIDNVLEQM